MGLEEIRTRLDAFVAAGTVPPEERDSVRAQVDELVASDPAGADLYRTALARLDPHLFPPPDATAWDRLLRAVRPRRPVSRESVEDQGFMMTSSLFAYSVLTPALRGLLTGEFPWLTPGQLAMTAAVTAVASVPAIYYLMPYGKSAQNQEDPEQNRIGRRTVVEAETLHTIFFMHVLGRIFDWDPLVTVWNAAWQGITKGYPMSEIYRRWGDERQGLWMRQGAMLLMMTDQALASSIASSGSSGVSLAQMGWVAAFNLLLGKALALIPERGRGATPQSAADPPPAVVPTEANARLQRRLAEAMQNQPETYVEAHCIQNTVLFIGRNLTDETIRHARILIVINRDVRTRGQLERLRPDRWFGSLNSTRPRASLIPKERWKYHVVLEVDGRFYDWDYRGKPGVPLADYAQEMFPDQDHDVVVIPANEFVGQLSIPGIDFQDRLSELIFDRSRERRALSDYAATRIRETGALRPFSDLADRSEIYRAWGAVQISRMNDGKFTLLYLSGESSTPFHFARVFEHHLSLRAGELSSLDVIIFSIDLPKGRKLGESESKDLEKRVLEVLERYQFGRGVAIVLKSGRKEQKIYVTNAMARLAELRREEVANRRSDAGDSTDAITARAPAPDDLLTMTYSMNERLRNAMRALPRGVGSRIYSLLTSDYTLRGRMRGPGYNIPFSDELRAEILMSLPAWDHFTETTVRVYGLALQSHFGAGSLNPPASGGFYMDLLVVKNPGRPFVFKGVGAVEKTDRPKEAVGIRPYHDKTLISPLEKSIFETLASLWAAVFEGPPRIAYTLISGVNRGRYASPYDYLELNLHWMAWRIRNTGTLHEPILVFVHEARHRMQALHKDLKFFDLKSAEGFINGRDVFDDYTEGEGETPHEIDARIITQKAHEILQGGGSPPDAVRTVLIGTAESPAPVAPPAGRAAENDTTNADPAARITQIREQIGELLEIRRALMGSYYPWYRDPRYEALKGLPSEKRLVELAREVVRLELDWLTPSPVGTALLGPWDRFNQAERALVAEPLNKEAAVEFVIARERYFLTTSPVPDNLADAGPSLPLDRHSKVVVQIPVYCELDNGHFFRLLRDFSRQTAGPETFELTFMVSEHSSEPGSDRNWPENEKTINLIRYLTGEVPQQPDWVAELAGWQRALLDSVKSGGFTIRLILTPGIERNIGKIRDEAAREAIRRARGEGRDAIIALMDADTQVSSDYVGRIRRHFEGGDCDALFMNLAFHSDEGGRDEFFYRTGYQSRYALTWTDVLSGSLFPDREMGVEVGAYQIAVKASVLERLGGIPHDAVNEDFHLARRISRRARWRFAPDLEVVTADREREVGFDAADRVADLGLLRQGEGLDQIHEPRHHYYIETLLPILTNMIRGSEEDEGRWSRVVTLFGISADWSLWTELRSQTAERIGGTVTDHSQFTVFTLYSYLVAVGNHKSLFPDDLLLSALGHFLSDEEAERLQERLREIEGAHDLTRQGLRRIMAIAVSNLNAGHELLQGIDHPDAHEFLRVNPWIPGYLERNRAHFSDGEAAPAFLEEQFPDWLKAFDETPVKKHAERMRILARFFQEARNSPGQFPTTFRFLQLIAGEVQDEEENAVAPYGDPAFAAWVGEKRLKKHLEQRPADRARILEVYRLFQKRSLDDFRLEDPTRLQIDYSRSISEGRGNNSMGVFAAALVGVNRPLAVKLLERKKFVRLIFAADTVRNYAILSAWGIGPTFYGLVDIPEKDAIGLVMDEVENDESFIPYGLSSRDDKFFDPETLAQLSGIKEFFEIFSAIPAPFEILRNSDGKLFAIDVSSISYFQAKAEELLKRLPPNLSALYFSGGIKADLVPDREVARTIAQMVFEYRDSLQSALHSLRELGLPVPPDHEIDTELAYTDYQSFLNLTETRIREMRAAAASTTPGLLALQRRVTEEMAAHPEVFAPNQCHFTVLNFLRRHIPGDQLSHIRVLCIRKKGGGDVIGGRGALKPNETLGDFQTTIEIGGRIYGYWYRGRPGVSIDTYVREMFPKEDLDDLTVLSIPAQEYVDYPDAAEALPYFWQRDDHKVVSLRDYVRDAMERYGHQKDFDEIERRLETYERYTTTVDVATNGDGITIRYNGGSGFTPAIFSQKLRDALGPTKESLTQARRVQLTVFVSADAVVEAQDIQQVATKELESAGYSGPVNLRLFRGTQASTRLFSIEPATAHPDPGPGMDGVPSPVLLAGGDFLAGGDWLAAPGLADYDLSWVPRSAAVIGGFALLFGGLVALDRYRTYRWQRDQLYRHLETWPEVRAVMHDALKAFRGNDTLPDWHVNIWRRKPNIVEHRFKTALAVSGMLRSVMAASEATLSSETKAESGVALREWAQSLTDLMNDFRGSFPPEVWKIYGTAALEKLGRAVGSLQTMIDTRLDQMSSEQDFPRRLSLVGMVSPSAQRRINLGRSSIQLLNRSIEEFEWDMLRDSLQILVVDGNPGQMPVRSIDFARGRGASGGVPNGTQWSRQVEKVADLLLGLIQLLHRHPERTTPLEKIFKVLACRGSELAEEGAQDERLKRIMRGLKSHMEALTLVHDVAAREPTHDENVSWKRIGEIVEKGDIPKNPFKIDRVTFQSRDRDLEKFRLETPQVQLVIENVEKLEIEKRAAFLQKFAGKPVVILFDPKQKIDASKLESVKGWVRVMVGEVLGIDPRRIEVIPTFYTAGLVDLAMARREGRTPAPLSARRTPPPTVTGTVVRPTLRVVPGRSPPPHGKDPKQGGGGGGGPMTALAIPVTRDEVEWRSDVSVIPASSEERGRGSRFGNPERVVVAEKSPEDQTLDSRPRNLRVAGMTEERRMPRDRDDDLRIRLTAFAHSRGLSDVASFLSRLNEDQSHALVKNSDRWREILERKGFAEWAQQLAHGETLSPSDRVFLVAAALGGSRKSIERLALSHAKSSAPTSPGAVAGGLIVGPVPLPGASSGILTITR